MVTVVGVTVTCTGGITVTVAVAVVPMLDNAVMV